MEIDTHRFLLPPHGVVLRFEEISVYESQRKTGKKTQKNGNIRERNNKNNNNGYGTPVIAHVTGAFLPNQITALMGSDEKTL